MVPVDFSTLHPSDIALLVCFALSAFLSLYFAIGKPRTWFHDPLGWVIFGYSVTTVFGFGLIAYAIVFGQKVDEPIRLVGTLLMIGGLVAKTLAVYGERRKGRLARLAATERTPLMSIPASEPSKQEAVAVATEIWYKAQRVLRTLVQVVIPAFLGFAVVLPLIIEALGLPVDSELRLWLLVVATGVTAVATAIARVMAIPAVNAWLIKIGLGSVPASAIDTQPLFDGTPVVVITEDPKVEGNS